MNKPTPSQVKTSQKICARILALLQQRQPPVVVALDGGSGSGKSTMAQLVSQELDAVIIPVDDFFAASIPEREWLQRSAEARLQDVFEWDRLRVEAIEPLRAGRFTRWRPFDFVAGPSADGTYSLQEQFVIKEPATVILLDGAYTAGPQLADLVDLAVLVDVPPAERHARLAEREDPDFLAGWHALWDEVEAYYFSQVRPPESFDMVIATAK